MSEEINLLKEINIMNGLLLINPFSAVTKLSLHRLYSEGFIRDSRPKIYALPKGKIYYLLKITQDGKNYLDNLETESKPELTSGGVY